MQTAAVGGRLRRRSAAGVVGVLVAMLTATGASATVPAVRSACGPRFTNALPALPWPLHRLDPQAAWPLSRGRNVVVAVIDSGVSDSHVKLAGKILPGRDFVTAGGDGTCDADGHGTAIAGIIAASDTAPDNGARFFGIAPDARILPVRVLPDSKQSTDETLPGRIASAIRYAADSGAGIINLSLTTPDTPALARAVAYARSKDVLMVAAAGNEGGTVRDDQPVFPAAYPGVVAVAGIDRDGKHVTTSTTGDYVAVAAPGLDIDAPATQGNGYVTDVNGGTSFAAAYVSGVAALVRSYAPRLTAPEVARRIRLTADAPPDGQDRAVGFGVVNPYRAVSAELDSHDVLVAPATGAAPALHRPVDPLTGQKRVAAWAASIGAVLAATLLLIAGIRRRNRQTTPAAAAVPGALAGRAGVLDDFVPVVGRRLTIATPATHRPAAPPPPGPGHRS
ncbi:MAG: rane-anchored mycosin [Actinoplanes sp.]|nr:rane-anchored mycosin [Actinoplanes sp.]